MLGAIAAAAVASALFLLVVRPCMPLWHGAHLRQIVGFGGPASGAGLLHVAITNIDYTILAARLSSAQVGFYWRAFQLGVVYQDKISGVMMRLAFPVYSAPATSPSSRRLHERATRVHGADCGAAAGDPDRHRAGSGPLAVWRRLAPSVCRRRSSPSPA